MSQGRVIGTETEYGVYRPGDPYANAVELSTLAVRAYAPYARGSLSHLNPIDWDYRGEDPLNDLRGRRLDRANADPSQLTDDPYRLAPPGGSEAVAAPTAEELRQYRPTSTVIANGGRLYVDHAHPEYSAPEVKDAHDATLWDRAGEVIAQRIMSSAQLQGDSALVLVKNNVDGKGATYGAHENYQVDRLTDLDDLVRFTIPFLVTRPIFCGAGRTGIGQRSEEPGFQISQRADYIENDVGLETTFNRPIFNTRDEPHADGQSWRRVHVINGDANMFDVSILLRTGTTALVLWAIEQDPGLTWEGLDLADPITAVRTVSRDLTLTQKLPLLNGEEVTAVELQRRYLELVRKAFEGQGLTPSDSQSDVLSRWAETLDRLETNLGSLASQVEWIGKHQLLDRQRARLGARWDDPRIVAMDLQWGDLRPDKSLVGALSSAGLVDRLFAPEQVTWAADNPPSGTRAASRGQAVSSREDLRQASWTSLVYASDQPAQYTRVPLADPTAKTEDSTDSLRPRAQ